MQLRMHIARRCACRPRLGLRLTLAAVLACWRRRGARRRTTRPAASAGWPRCRARSGCTTPSRASGSRRCANRPFTGGDRLVHRADGRRWSCASVRPRCCWAAQAELEALRLDDERMQFALQRGSSACGCARDEVARRAGAAAPAKAASLPLRAGLYRIDRQDETSDAGVLARRPAVRGATTCALTLYAGQRAEFWRDGPLGDTTQPVAEPAARRVRAGVLQRRTRPIRAAPPPVYVSPEMTGVEDLDRYGRWQQHPEYGAVWSADARWRWAGRRTATATGSGCAPGVGPGSTMHRGASRPSTTAAGVWWGNRWCWAPGPRVARPVYAPALVGLGRRRRSSASSVGSRPVPAVGWVPLAPRELYRAGLPRQPGLRAAPELRTHRTRPDCRRRAYRQPRRARRRDGGAGARADAAAAGGCRCAARRRTGAAPAVAGRALPPRRRRAASVRRRRPRRHGRSRAPGSAARRTGAGADPGGAAPAPGAVAAPQAVRHAAPMRRPPQAAAPLRRSRRFHGRPRRLHQRRLSASAQPRRAVAPPAPRAGAAGTARGCRRPRHRLQQAQPAPHGTGAGRSPSRPHPRHSRRRQTPASRRRRQRAEQPSEPAQPAAERRAIVANGAAHPSRAAHRASAAPGLRRASGSLQQRLQHRPDVVQHARLRLRAAGGCGRPGTALSASGPSATPASRKGTSAAPSALATPANRSAKSCAYFWP